MPSIACPILPNSIRPCSTRSPNITPVSRVSHASAQHRIPDNHLGVLPLNAHSDTATPPRPPGPTGVARRTARGFTWLALQSVGEKCITLLAQVALARLLAPHDFKLVALTYTITTFAALLQQAGLSQVLIQRARKFHLWSTPALWMSLALGLLAAAATAAAAPLAASFYAEPALLHLLLAASIALPLNSLMTVPEARLRADMRFRFLSALGLAAILASAALSVALAALGYGALAFILPPVIVALPRAAALWWFVKPPIHLRPRFRAWRFLLTDSTFLLLASLAMMATYQGGQVILGRMYPALAAAGLYYFAWNLSDQSLRLLVNNLTGVLFPALASLRDHPERQTAAFVRATRALVIVGLPPCLLQAVLAGPLIRLVFGAKWDPAIPVMAALCVGMSARLVHGPSESLLLARRQTRTLFLLGLAFAAVFLAAVAFGAHLAGQDHAATGAAIAAGVSLFLLGPVILRLALADAPDAWFHVVRIYAAPSLAALVAFVPAYALISLLPRTTLADAAAIAIAGILSSLIYAAAIRVLLPEQWRELTSGLLATIRARLRR
ncbi:MAG: oligosaccharide flippase family protein [Phycisphaerae bacterium]|nr:oligosaccharide flippase family protein [Phycisphaerae bacterium]